MKLSKVLENLRRVIKRCPTWLIVIMLIQLAILGVMLMRGLTAPRFEKKISWSELSLEKSDYPTNNLSIKGDQLILKPHENVTKDSVQVLSTEPFSLPYGSFWVKVVYQIDCSEPAHWNNSNASVEIKPKDTIIVGGGTQLFEGEDSMTYKLWVPATSCCDDAVCRVTYQGGQKLTLKSITIKESLIYRFTQMMGILVLLAVCDLLIVYFLFETPKIDRRFVILLLIIVVASLNFFSKKIVAGDDFNFHMGRLSFIASELKNGQFPVRMYLDSNNGFSYPSSIFYGDIFLYPAAVLYLMGIPLQNCYCIYMIAINVLTAIVCFHVTGKITQNDGLRLIATAFYVLSNYRLVNGIDRAAVGEFTAMTFLPLVFVGMYLIYTSECPRFKEWKYLAIGMTGIILSHTVTFEMVTVELLMFCVFLWAKTFQKERIRAMFCAAFTTFGITAWFLVPFVDYLVSHDTVVEKSNLRLIQNRALSIIQMISVKEYSFGISVVVALAICLFLVKINCGKQYKDRKNIFRGRLSRKVWV